MQNFYALIDKLNALPAPERKHMEQEIWSLYGVEKAILALDMPMSVGEACGSDCAAACSVSTAARMPTIVGSTLKRMWLMYLHLWFVRTGNRGNSERKFVASGGSTYVTICQTWRCVNAGSRRRIGRALSHWAHGDSRNDSTRKSTIRRIFRGRNLRLG